MRIQCDSCESKFASVMCCADEAALCSDCDARIHSANKLASKHQRVPFLTVSEPSHCDICQEKLAFFFCLEDRALLCQNCDLSIHTANALSSKHRRFLVPGTCMSLDAIPVVESIEPLTLVASTCSAEVSPSFHDPCIPKAVTQSLKSGERLIPSSCAANMATDLNPRATFGVPSSASHHSNNVILPSRLQGASAANLMSMPSLSAAHQSSGLLLQKSSIAEFLTDPIPGWQVDELLKLPDLDEGYNISDSAKGEAMTLGEVDWMPGFSLHQNQLIADALCEVPQLPYPQTPALPEVMPHPSRANSGTLKGKRNQEPILPTGFCDAFVVPDLDIQQSPYFPKRRKKL
ncbi:unnamed protein product [Sphagnum jensenii]|uniref:B box-type domain-containing protein n=1 Tax=Sphagnum jensenii TaxID=128206 RepID=A0ABP0WJV9_9BRYO